MKKTYLSIFAIIAIVVAGLWLYQSKTDLTVFESGQYIVIAILIIFGLYFGLRKLLSAKRGEPDEDELSKKLTTKAAAISFYVSLYLWLVIMYISSENGYNNESTIGAGIIGMSLLFAISWVILKVRGIPNE